MKLCRKKTKNPAKSMLVLSQREMFHNDNNTDSPWIGTKTSDWTHYSKLTLKIMFKERKTKLWKAVLTGRIKHWSFKKKKKIPLVVTHQHTEHSHTYTYSVPGSRSFEERKKKCTKTYSINYFKLSRKMHIYKCNKKPLK